MQAEGIESVAVCLLFSFLYPGHERRVGELARAALGPGVHVSLSVDILPEYREYERTATTAINAYVAPLMSRYLQRLTAEIARGRWRSCKATAASSARRRPGRRRRERRSATRRGGWWGR